MGYNHRVKQTHAGLTITGTITTTRKGLGFIADPKDEENDVAIDVGFLNMALNGDTVEVLVHGKGQGPKNQGPKNSKYNKTGEVVRVVSRVKDTYVGTVDTEQGFYFVMIRKCIRISPSRPMRRGELR
jgi:exoribonuclease R